MGGSATSIVFAYGQASTGMVDWETANRQALSGVIGSGAGVLASAGALSVVAAYGTAGTGVAISTLSGAAATNASLAVLGGGTVASGGFGMGGGAVVLGTGVGVVIVAVGAGVMYGFHLADEAGEAKRIKLMLKYYAGVY